MFTRIYSGCKVTYHAPIEALYWRNLIYILAFPNGKYYVGQTVCRSGLCCRISGHCSVKHEKNAFKTNIINKYKRFDVFILHRCTPEEDIDFFEQFYIEILKSRLVNVEKGGKYVANSSWGKISICQLGGYMSKPPKGVICYDKLGNKLSEYNSVKEAALALGISEHNVMSGCARTKVVKKAYQLRYVDSTRPIGKVPPIKIKKEPLLYRTTKFNGEKVIYNKFYTYLPNGEFYKEFDATVLSSSECFEITSSIRDNVTYGGLKWRTEKYDRIEQFLTANEIWSNKTSQCICQCNLQGDPIYIWKSIKEASYVLNVDKSTLAKHLRGKESVIFRGFLWKKF